MKDFEKIAVAIGAAALGLAAYQAYKVKEAADSTEATDPAKNPISTAIDLAQHTIGGVGSWFRQRLDSGTGYVKGKSEDILDTLSVVPQTGLYMINKAKDFGLGATEAGTKYLWSWSGKAAKTGKEVKEHLTNKPFTLMGSIPEHIYYASRQVPKVTTTLYNILTGANSGKEKTTKKTGGAQVIKDWMQKLPYNTFKYKVGGDRSCNTEKMFHTLAPQTRIREGGN